MPRPDAETTNARKRLAWSRLQDALPLLNIDGLLAAVQTWIANNRPLRTQLILDAVQLAFANLLPPVLEQLLGVVPLDVHVRQQLTDVKYGATGWAWDPNLSTAENIPRAADQAFRIPFEMLQSPDVRALEAPEVEITGEPSFPASGHCLLALSIECGQVAFSERHPVP